MDDLLHLDDGAGGDDPAAIAADLTVALELAPDHPAAGLWEYHLAFAHSAIAGSAVTITADDAAGRHWDAAVEHIRAVVDLLDATDDAALILYRRFLALVQGDDDPAAERRLTALEHDLTDIGPGAAGASLIRGLAAADRYALGDGGDGDLDRTIALLTTALDELPDDQPFVPLGLAELASALDRAATRDAADEQPADEHRDAAIAALDRLRPLVDGDLPPEFVLLDGELRVFRGADRDAADDLTSGVAQLLAYVAAVPAEDQWDREYVELLLQSAYERLWSLTKDRAALDGMVGHGEAALARGLSADYALEVHRFVVEAEHERIGSPADQAARRAGSLRWRAAVAVLDGEEGDLADRARLAASACMLGVGLLAAGPGLVDIGALPRLAELAHLHPAPPTEFTALVALLDNTLQMLGPGGDFRRAPNGAVREMLSTWRTSELPAEFDDVFIDWASGAQALEAVRNNDRGGLRAAAALRERIGRHDAFDPFLRMLLAFRDGPGPELDDAMDEALAAVDADDPWAFFTGGLLRTMQALLSGGPPPPLELPDLGADPAAAMLADLLLALNRLATMQHSAHDPMELWRLLDDERDQIINLELGGPARIMATFGIAIMYVQLARLLPGEPRSIEAAVEWSAAALEMFDGPEHELWAQAAMVAAEAHRLRRAPDDLPRSRALALDALRGHVWTVLVQSGTEHALASARAAADVVGAGVEWCVQDRVADDMVRLIEIGRGLALHAATTSRDVAAQLVAVGAEDLAAEWERAGGVDLLGLPAVVADVPLHGDLRHRVLRTLRAALPELLDPPDPAQIRAALRRHDSDALVYLITDPDGSRGRAVVVPADGPVEVLDLPRLRTGPGSALERYSAAYRRWAEGLDAPAALADDPAGHPFMVWAEELETLCRWAWTAVGDTLLDAAPDWSAGSVPRLVLVPVGPLALIPWHAAARFTTTGDRYLVEDAVLSYAASARLFCVTTERSDISEGTALIVGNPNADLPAAGREAQAVRAAFHPDAEYLGHVGTGPGGHPSPDGRGSAAQVLERIADGPPRPVVHFACHARAVADAAASSYLALCGDHLLAGEIVERNPTSLLRLGVVVLAACTTHVAGDQYDEAFSLSTAFLAAGARTAIGTMWTVPDQATSELAFLVHHHLAEGLPPADAVRRAQLWMLDPGRTPPRSMSDHLHRVGRSGVLPREHPLNWAGLTHLGR